MKQVMCFQNTMMGHAKQETGKKEGVMGPQQVQNLARQTPWDLRLRNNPLWPDTLASRPSEAEVLPPGLCWRRMTPISPGRSCQAYWNQGNDCPFWNWEGTPDVLWITVWGQSLLFLKNSVHLQLNSSMVPNPRSPTVFLHSVPSPFLSIQTGSVPARVAD